MPGPELVLAVLLAACLRPPAPKPETASASEFSAGRAVRVLERLLAEGVPHPTGTPANAVVRDRIVAELEGQGYAVEVQRAFSCRAGLCAFVENIVTRLAGSAPTASGDAGSAPAAGGAERGAVMLASHYDSRGAGPGAGDAGAAVASILEVARIVRMEAPFRNDVIVLLTDGEELGLLGAEAFVREHPWAADVALVINLEARGTTGPSIMFETSAENRWLVREFGRAVSRPVASSLTYDVYRLLPNDTDATVFRRVGMDVLNFAFIGGLVRYHTVRDDVAHLDRGSLQHHGDNALATVRHFASIPLQRTAAGGGDAAYTDLFGRFLVRWPASWQLPISIVLALVVVTAAVRFVARGRASVAALAWGALATSLGLIAAVVFGFAFGALLTAVTGRPGTYHAYPQPASATLWGGALVMVLGTGLLLARRAGFAGLFAGVWLVLALLTIAVSAVLPGAAVVLVIPLAIGAAAVLGAALLPGERAGVGAVIVACLGAALTLVPLALLVQSAFVLQMPFAIAAVVGLGALPLLPLTAVPLDAARMRGALIVGASVVIVAGVAALVVPGYSRAAPEPMNVAYIEDEAAGEAAWVVQGLRPGAAALPPDLQNVMQFRDPPVPDWAPPFIRGPWAPAPAAGLPQPHIEMLAEETAADGSGRIVMLRLVPSAAGDRLVLIAPAGTNAQFGGTRVPPARSRAPGRDMWVVDGAPAEGTVVTLALRTGAPGDVALYAFRSAAVVRADSPGPARPETAGPFGDGDVAVSVVRRVF